MDVNIVVGACVGAGDGVNVGDGVFDGEAVTEGAGVERRVILTSSIATSLE